MKIDSSNPKQRNVFANECNFFNIDTGKVRDTIPDICVRGHSGVLVVGDSHAQALSAGLSSYFTERGINYNLIASSGCAIGKGYVIKRGRYKNACEKSHEFLYKTLPNISPELIIIIQKSNHEINDYTKFLTEINQLTPRPKVLVIGPSPQWRPKLLLVGKEEYLNGGKFIESNVQTVFKTDAIMLNKSRFKYISLVEYLCEEKACLAFLDDGNPITFDYGHLTIEGSKYITNTYLKDPLDNYKFLAE
jgi:hypothetical protein